MRASPIDWRRCFGSRTRQRRTSCPAAAGSSAGSALHSGSAFSTDARTSETVSPANACLPVSSSYSTTPNDQMSERRSAF
jgi:hypothetical protein